MIKGKEAQSSQQLIPEISDRWSPRAFSDRPVEPEKLTRLMEAARWAPSSNNGQPWHFILGRQGEKHFSQLLQGLVEGNRVWAWTAPVLGISMAKRRFEYKNRENLHFMHDVGLAMGRLLAQATHENLYVHMMGGIDRENIYESFGIDANEYEVVSMFAIGYHDENRLDELDDKYRELEYKARSRKPLSEMVSGVKFGDAPDWL